MIINRELPFLKVKNMLETTLGRMIYEKTYAYDNAINGVIQKNSLMGCIQAIIDAVDRSDYSKGQKKGYTSIRSYIKNILNEIKVANRIYNE